MSVNPVFTEKDLKKFDVFLLDELLSIVAVLRELTTCYKMPHGTQCIILWCADSIERMEKILNKEVKSRI